MADLDLVLEFEFPPLGADDDLPAACDALRLDALSRDLNIAAVAEWLAEIGVLSEPDPLRLLAPGYGVPVHLVDPTTDLPTREGYQFRELATLVRAHHAGGIGMVGQVLQHIEAMTAAMKDTSVPREARLRAFTTGLCRAQDAAAAAIDAGYRSPSILNLFDTITGIFAAAAGLLRDEITRRAGQITGEQATAALAMLNDKWTPQVAENAARFAAMTRKAA